MSNRLYIGFMQGRLSPLVNGMIQAFPWGSWRDEFPLAQKANLTLMEWTLDQDRLRENPLLTVSGQTEVRGLCDTHSIRIPSLTGDCFMQAPLWKAQGSMRTSLETDFIDVAKGSSAIGVSLIIVPLVDNGRLESKSQEDNLVTFMENQASFLTSLNMKILFESDYGPQELGRFISRLDSNLFGINYDIGNSAAQGFNVAEEFASYGSRILNVHVKDRVLGGTTVPLGTGAANFDEVFFGLNKLGYRRNFILQTARASDSNHVDTLCRYRDLTSDFLRKYES